MLKDVMKRQEIRSIYHDSTDNIDVITRFSLMNNDKVNGVWLQFYTQLAIKPCELTDYDVQAAAIQIPPLINHEHHKH